MDNFKVEFLNLIKLSDRILLTTHRGPDADAYGSVLALLLYLKEIFAGKKFEILIEGEDSNTFTDLTGLSKIGYTENLMSDIEKFDLVILLDGNSMGRFTKFGHKSKGNAKFICLDHHKSEGENFNLKLVDPTYASTTHLIYREIIDAKFLINEVASLILFGILGDTGGLTYISKSNVDVLIVVKELVEFAEIDIEKMKSNLSRFSDNSFTIFQEFVRNTNKVMISKEFGQVTFSYLGREFLNGLGDKSRIIEFNFQALILRNLADSIWGFTVKPDTKDLNIFNLSFRSSKGGPNVRLICEKYFNGGGHDRAAGGSFKLSDYDLNLDSMAVVNKIIDILKSATLEIC